MAVNEHAASDVRHVRADEWRALRALRLEALQDSPRSFGSTFAQEAARLDEQWQSQAAKLAAGEDNVGVAAVAGDRWVAMALGYLEDVGADTAQRNARLIAVYVTPDWRGRGVAKAVSSKVVDWARSRGAPEIRLYVTDWNVAARRTYERLGFTPTGKTTALPHDPTVVETEMRLPLDEAG